MFTNRVRIIFSNFVDSVWGKSSVEDEVDEADDEESDPQDHQRQFDQLEN